MVKLRGRAISKGAFEGVAYVLDARGWISAAADVRSTRSPDWEAERLRAAHANAATQLERVESKLADRGSKSDSEIFIAHRAMMRDPVLLRRLETAVLEEGLSAEAAVARTISALRAEFLANPAPMVSDKADDILDIGYRLLRCLDPQLENQSLDASPKVLVASVITPSELVRFAHLAPCAVLTERCGPKSHAAILARSLGVPFVTGIANVTGQIEEGALVFVDAEDGIVLVDPGEHEREEVERIRASIARGAIQPSNPRQPVTRDGVPIELALNISDASEAGDVSRLGASGVGLFRTEFLYMDRASWPDEEASFALYDATATALGDAELHIRLADFGADKCPEYADFEMGRNPSLGLRGVRLLLRREDILAPQIRAIERIAERRPVVVLVPMLDSVDTLRRLTRSLNRLCRAEAGKLPFQLAGMIEVPAAAIAIESILEEVDRVAIGLNDLTQYVLAADREDESVAHYHDAMQPAVLHLVAEVLAAAASANKPASICGELAGDPGLTAVLLALGARRLSVSRADYVRALGVIEDLSAADLTQQREVILAAKTASEVRRLVADLYRSAL